MPINSTQRAFVEDVRNGDIVPGEVFERLIKAPNVGYRSQSFLESLLALDSTNRLKGDEWYKILVKGVIKHSTFFDDGMIDPQELVHLEEWFDRYGVGEYGLELVVEMTHFATQTPPNWNDLVRRTFRKMYSGIHPIDEHGMFVLTRWIDMQNEEGPIGEEDASLISHINRHTKGLVNEQSFQRLYATTIGDYVCRTKDDPGFSSGLVWLDTELQKCPEISGNETTLFQYLGHHGVGLTESIQAYAATTAPDRLIAERA